MTLLPVPHRKQTIGDDDLISRGRNHSSGSIETFFGQLRVSGMSWNYFCREKLSRLSYSIAASSISPHMTVFNLFYFYNQPDYEQQAMDESRFRQQLEARNKQGKKPEKKHGMGFFIFIF